MDGDSAPEAGACVDMLANASRCPDMALARTTLRNSSSLLCQQRLAAPAGLDVCAAVALSAATASMEDMPAWCGAECRDLVLFQHNIALLYDVNLYDAVLELCTVVVLAASLLRRYHGFAISASFLVALLLADIALSVFALRQAQLTQPVAHGLLRSSCLDLGLSTSAHNTLVTLEGGLQQIFALGLAEVAVAAWAAVGDVRGLLKLRRGRRVGESKMKSRGRLLRVFVPAGLDLLLSLLDFFVLTTATAERSNALVESIQRQGCEWCVALSESARDCSAAQREAAQSVDDAGRKWSSPSRSEEMAPLLALMILGTLAMAFGVVNNYRRCTRCKSGEPTSMRPSSAPPHSSASASASASASVPSAIGGASSAAFSSSRRALSVSAIASSIASLDSVGGASLRRYSSLDDMVAIEMPGTATAAAAGAAAAAAAQPSETESQRLELHPSPLAAQPPPPPGDGPLPPPVTTESPNPSRDPDSLH